MRTESKRFYRNIMIRFLLVLAAIAIQIWWFVVIADLVAKNAPWAKFVYTYLPFLMILYIYGRETNAAFKMPWMILIAALPFFGVCMYVILGHHNGTPGMRRRFRAVEERTKEYLPEDHRTLRDLAHRHLKLYRQAYYLQKRADVPVYRDTQVQYYNDAARAFEQQLRDLEKAKRFIFLEYYAIEEGGSFERMKRILGKKAKEGVEVRVIYDDIGSKFSLRPRHFEREMKRLGIRCLRFNPMLPVLNIFMVNRDHRKIMVVDGKLAYTGGYNLANEYFHRTSPYGWWKDAGVRLEGRAARSFTVFFLQMWDSVTGGDSRIANYLEDEEEPSAQARCRIARIEQQTSEKPAAERHQEMSGEETFVQPYVDTPLDQKRTGEEVYMNLIRAAERYVYISSPYLILTDEMVRELTSAAERGVDVRIAIPGTPDKRFVYLVTRAYCDDLILRGVKVYRYLPGFNHSKLFAVDDEMCTVGTVNMDFRSFYHHFEDGVLIFGRETARLVRNDLMDMYNAGQIIDKETVGRYRHVTKFGHTLLRLLAPIL
jgi:cardiolipin synthase